MSSSRVLASAQIFKIFERLALLRILPLWPTLPKPVWMIVLSRNSLLSIAFKFSGRLRRSQSSHLWSHTDSYILQLPNYNTVDDAVDLIKKSKNIIVLTGAGISTSLGIPDFRSKEIGLYSKLASLGLPIGDPQDVFNIEVFKQDPNIFFTVAKDILPEIDRYTPTHKFIYLLQQKGKLLTNYSQNIDNIESAAGILPEKLIQCHGSFATATCFQCGYQVPGETIFADIRGS